MLQCWRLLAPATPMHPGRSLSACPPHPQRASARAPLAQPDFGASQYRDWRPSWAWCFQWCCRCRRRHRCCTRAAGATANAELPMPLSALLCCCHYCDDACWPSLFSAALADMVCGRACMVAARAGAVRRLAPPGLCLPESRGVFRSRLGRKGSTTCTPRPSHV